MKAARLRAMIPSLFAGYDLGNFYDEMFSRPGEPRRPYAKVFERLASISSEQFDERRKLADLSFLIQGITFTVYSDGRGTERLFPFDLIPRILQFAMGENRTRPCPARDSAQSFPAGCLWQAVHF